MFQSLIGEKIEANRPASKITFLVKPVVDIPSEETSENKSVI